MSDDVGDARPRVFWGHWGEVPVVEDANFVWWRSSCFFRFRDLSETSSSWSAVSDLYSQSFFLASCFCVNWLICRLTFTLVFDCEYHRIHQFCRAYSNKSHIHYKSRSWKGWFFAAVFFFGVREALSPNKRKKWCIAVDRNEVITCFFLWLKAPQVWVEQNHQSDCLNTSNVGRFPAHKYSFKMVWI